MTKVLIVDDDPDFVAICRTVLTSEDYEVMEAANGTQALAAMKKDIPDVVLLDVMMSTTLEGVDVSREMDLDENLKDIPTIMVSSIATTEYASEFPDNERIPIDAWISKPIQPKILLNTIRRVLDLG